MTRCCLVLLIILALGAGHAAGADEPQAAGRRAAMIAARAELRTAERIATLFFRGRHEDILPYFQPDLATRVPVDRLAELQGFLERFGGAPRHVQAAYYLPRRRDDAVRRAAVPLDYENGSVDLLLAWVGELGTGTLVDFDFRRHEARPARALPVPTPRLAPPWLDPNYVLGTAVEDARWTIIAPHGRIETRLVMPRGDIAPPGAPAVLLLADRAGLETTDPTRLDRPLDDLARGLATEGIAVLRLARRHGPDTPPGAVYTLQEDLLEDAAAALAELARAPGVDPLEVWVAGWQTGAPAAVELASRAPVARGLILLDPVLDWSAERAISLAAPGLDGAEVARLRELDRACLTGNSTASALILDAPCSYWADLLTRDAMGLLDEWRRPGLVLLPAQGGLATPLEREALIAWGAAAAPRLTFVVTATETALLPPAGTARHLPREAVRAVSTMVWDNWRAHRAAPRPPASSRAPRR
jgi:hypothetical protein